MNMNWLKRDAWNRAWRTIMQTVALVVIAPAVDAAVQAVHIALADGAAGAGWDWQSIGRTAASAAVMGASMSVLAYLHRRVLDPSAIPSAQPPAPPPIARGMAQR